MHIRLLYFARLREAFGTAAEEIGLPEHITTVANLLIWLRARGGNWASELAEGRAFRVAVDQEMASPATALDEGAEVAIFPPVTGG